MKGKRITGWISKKSMVTGWMAGQRRTTGWKEKGEEPGAEQETHQNQLGARRDERKG